MADKPVRTPAGMAIEEAFAKITYASGRLALVLSVGRGLTPDMLNNICKALEEATAILRTLQRPQRRRLPPEGS